MKKRGSDGGREWLLIKERDGWAKKEGEAGFLQESILSGLTLEEVASAAARADAIRSDLERLGAPRRPVAAADVGLMLAESHARPFTRVGWIWELKYDG